MSEFADAWLEISTCTGCGQQLTNKKGKNNNDDGDDDNNNIAIGADNDCDGVRAAKIIPPISEVLEVAERASVDMPAKKHSSIFWEYSRRLNAHEISQVMNAIEFTTSTQGYRHITFSTCLTYKGSSYTLTLFAIKKTQ